MQEALSALAAFYGPIPPPPRDLFAFFVWDVISARTLPARRDRVWQALKLLPALTPDAMFRASKDELKAALDGLTGVEERLDMLREGSGHLRRHRDLPDRVGRSPLAAARVLRAFPHLTPSARAVGVVFVGRHAVPAVDAGSARVLVRYHQPGFARPAAQRRAVRRLLGEACGGEVERLTRALVVLGHHGANACSEQAPHCGVCPLRRACAHVRPAPDPGPDVGAFS